MQQISEEFSRRTQWNYSQQESSKQPNPKAHENQQFSDKKETPSEKPPVKESASSNLISVVHSSAGGSTGVITHCRIIQVILFHKNNPLKAIKIYALLDDASNTTFITTQVQRELGIEGVEISLDFEHIAWSWKANGTKSQWLGSRAFWQTHPNWVTEDICKTKHSIQTRPDTKTRNCKQLATP